MKSVILPMVVAAVLRVAFLAASWDSPFLAEPLVDAREFHDEAIRISGGEGLPDRPYDRPPLYSYLVALVYASRGPEMRHVFPLQAILGVATVGLAAFAAGRLFGARVALVAGLLLALCRVPLVLEGQLLAETLQTFLLTAALAAWVEAGVRGAGRAARRRTRGGVWILLGAVAGALAVLTRPASALVVVPSLLALALGSRRRGAGDAGGHAPRGFRPAHALAGLVVVVVAVGIVTVRNRVVGGEWVTVSYNGGINFFIGNAERHEELMDVRPGLRWERLSRTPRALEGPGAFRLDPWRDGFAAWDARYYDAAFADIAANPLGWLGRLGRKALQFWSHVEIERNLPLAAFIPPGSAFAYTTLPFGAIAPLALAGLVLLPVSLLRRREEMPAAAGLFPLAVLGVWLTCVLYFVTARYRVPAYPAMVVLAGWMLVHVGNALRGVGPAQRRRAGVALGTIAAATGIVFADPGRARAIAPARGAHLEAIALERLGRTGDALRAHQRAIERHPEDPDALVGPMALLLGTGQAEAAIPLGERAVAVLPDHPTPLFNLGLAYLAVGRNAEAARTFERLTVVSPRDARAWYQLGRSLLLSDRPDFSLRALARAAELAPEMPLPHLERARALLRLERPAEARAALDVARRLDPGVGRLIGADPELAPLLGE